MLVDILILISVAAVAMCKTSNVTECFEKLHAHLRLVTKTAMARYPQVARCHDLSQGLIQ